MFHGYLSGRAPPRRAFGNAALVVVCIAAGVIAMPAAAADAAVPVPFVSTATSVSAGAVVTDGTTLTVTFGATPVLASSYSLTLTDGSDVGTLSSTAGNLTAAVTGLSIVFTVHGAPSMSVGSGLSLSGPLEILETTGVSDGSGDGWDLVASGQVVLDASNDCSTVGFTRVFTGSNCDIGLVPVAPMAPGVFDVIPLPTQDLPGPPDDNAPEVVTNCAPGSTDWVYDVNTEAQLGSKPCGLATNPPEQDIGNTNSDTLDYIPTPNLALVEEVGVVETIPGSSYVSATVVPPQLSAVTVSGDQAMFSYYGNVVCESSSSDPNEVSQFTYVTPYTDLTPGHPLYASAISCPPPSGGSSIAVTWATAIPASTGVLFKYTGYGVGHSIVGASSDASVGEREASESAYAGPSTTIDSLTPQSTTLPTSSGGSVDVALTTTGATQWEDCDDTGSNCSAIAGATAPSYIVTTVDTGRTLSVQETASNTSGSTTATAAATTTVPGASTTPPAPVPAPVDASLPTVSGTPAVGHTLTESHGSSSNAPASYAYVWERCGLAGENCVAIPGAIAQTHTLTAADVGHTLRVQETASNASGVGAAATSSPTAPVPTAHSSSKHHAPPNTLLLEHEVSSHDHRATFRFKATGTATRFECALVRKPTRSGEKTPAPEYVSCHSPKTFTRLTAGTYVLYVRAVGPGGADKTPASYEFKIA